MARYEIKNREKVLIDRTLKRGEEPPVKKTKTKATKEKADEASSTTR